MIHGDRATPTREFDGPLPAARQRARAAGHRRGRHGGDAWRRTCPRMLEAHYGGADGRRRAQRAQLPAGRADHRLHPRARRREAPASPTPSSRATVARGARPAASADPGGRHRRSAADRRAAPGEQDVRGAARRGGPAFEWQRPADEWQALALLYTSGTTGNPKGVVYHHRGAYLNALGNALAFGLDGALGLPVDAADVPLQRLDVHVGGDGGRRHARVPSQGRPGARSSR